jgi:hypothetical protein
MNDAGGPPWTNADESIALTLADVILAHISYKKTNLPDDVFYLRFPPKLLLSKKPDGLQASFLPREMTEVGELLRINLNVFGDMSAASDMRRLFHMLVLPLLEGVGQIACRDTSEGFIILAADERNGVCGHEIRS